MKMILMPLFVLLMTTAANAQKLKDKEIPAAVISAFQKAYPQITKVSWEKENGHYEAEFDAGKIENSVLFDAGGNILETETEIAATALPARAKNYLSEHYPSKSVKEAAKITDTKGTVTYEAEVGGKDLIFDESGNFIKETTE
jgi:hypothetical protein